VVLPCPLSTLAGSQLGLGAPPLRWGGKPGSPWWHDVKGHRPEGESGSEVTLLLPRSVLDHGTERFTVADLAQHDFVRYNVG